MTPVSLMRMSHRDISMYYQGTCLPIAVENAVNGKGIAYIRNIVENQSEGEYHTFVADCNIYFIKQNGDMGRTSRNVSFSEFLEDGLTIPHSFLGYVKVGDTAPQWYTTRASLTNRKGITSERVRSWCHSPAVPYDHEIELVKVLAYMSGGFEGRISNDFCEYEGKLLYKGRIVGNVTARLHRLFAKYGYLRTKLSKESQKRVLVLSTNS